MITIPPTQIAAAVATLTLTEREVNKATARGINRATAVGRLAAQASIGTVFPAMRPTARRFLALMVRHDRETWATPAKLESRLRVGAPSHYLRAPWMILPTFEEGGTQTARDNVPTLGFRRPVLAVGRDRATTPRVKNVALAYRTDPGGSLILATGQRKPKARQGGRKGAGRVYGAERTFLIRLPSGIAAVMQRTAPGKAGVRALWWLRPSQRVPARPWFAAPSERATRAVLDGYVAEELRRQLTWAWERRGSVG